MILKIAIPFLVETTIFISVLVILSLLFLLFKPSFSRTDNNKKTKIHIGKYSYLKVADYTKFPGPAYASLGKHSGEEYREKVFLPALKTCIENNEKLIVDLSGTVGYGPSFLQEAFKFDSVCTKEKFRQTVSFDDAERPWYPVDVKIYLGV